MIWTVRLRDKLSHVAQSNTKQQGVALIVVMLIVALITILAIEMSGRLQVNIARTSNVKGNNQAFWYALGAEQFAKSSLATLQSLTSDNINLSQPWAEEFEYPVDGGTIKAKLTDLQACFNLNAINSNHSSTPNATDEANSPSSTPPETPASNPNPQPTSTNSNAQKPSHVAFQQLLEHFVEDTYNTETIRDALIDWIDEDDNPSPLGAEDADYESLVSPYLSANTLMSHPSEIRLLNGIDELAQNGILNDLKKAICVIPEENIVVNVNTITDENAVVLAALLGDTLQTGLDIINSRPQTGFADVADFLGLPEVQALNLDAKRTQWFDITTRYFKLDTTAKFQGTQFRMSTVFKLESGDTIVIISREFGGAF